MSHLEVPFVLQLTLRAATSLHKLVVANLPEPRKGYLEWHKSLKKVKLPNCLLYVPYRGLGNRFGRLRFDCLVDARFGGVYSPGICTAQMV